MEYCWLDVLEADTYAFWVGFARRPGGASGTRWFRSGIPFLNYNGVVGADADPDAMLRRAHAWGVPARWMVNDASTPDGFEATLATRGLVMVDASSGMVARIQDLPAPPSVAMTVDVVRDDAQFDTWMDVFADAFGLTAEATRHVRAAHTWPCRHDACRTYLIMRSDGAAVATGLLHSSPGVAGVYGIGVRRAFQKRGLGALATLLTVREGARTGAQIAVLQATKEGFPVYRKLGFQTICSFRSWRIA
jgi:hypothetical protein